MENQYDKDEGDWNATETPVNLEKAPENAENTAPAPDTGSPYPVYTPSPDRKPFTAEQQEGQSPLNGQNPPPDYDRPNVPNQRDGYGNYQGAGQNNPYQYGENSNYGNNNGNQNTSYYEAPNYQNQANGNYSMPNEPQKGKGMAIASLVLGVLSVISFCCVYLPIFLGIAGVVLGILSKNGNKKFSTEALIGIILSAVGVVISIGMIAIVMYLYKNGIYQEILQMYSTTGI